MKMSSIEEKVTGHHSDECPSPTVMVAVGALYPHHRWISDALIWSRSISPPWVFQCNLVMACKVRVVLPQCNLGLCL